MGAGTEAAQTPSHPIERPVRRAPQPGRRPDASFATPVAAAVAAPAEVSEPVEETDGEWLRFAEEFFPVAWLAMLCVVCYIGVYFAVEALPGRNLLPGPGWFS